MDLILLIVFGIAVYVAYKQYRKKSIASLDDYVSSYRIKDQRKDEFEDKICHGPFVKKKFTVHCREYKYRKFNLPKIYSLLENISLKTYDCEDCDYIHGIDHAGKEYSKFIDVYKVFKLKQNPFDDLSPDYRMEDLGTFSFLRKWKSEPYRSTDSFEMARDTKSEHVKINCILGYYRHKIILLFFEQKEKGEKKAVYTVKDMVNLPD